ncbi:MAG TPA: class I tRNA ligase family protein, partial [Chitinophagaceae bacterium]|nr:class I tRNA ligase family protein [Chitinophagaceae bacterium]
MEYKFRHIEKKWQEWWKENKVYQVSNDSAKPKYYVLDMFPYPSGAGLHVGHPLGYIASDIYARFKRLKGFNVLHPMGYDAFGLPAEQYAIEHGIHPAISTENNINNFRKQLDNIGFSFDWEREVRTSDPEFYKWTQWIFLQLFGSFYNRKTNKAEPIANLIKLFETEGNYAEVRTATEELFSAAEWKSFDEKKQQDILMQYRLAYCGYGEVNWCEALGTVLANDEVINGVSERGGYPVVKKKLRQWYLRITEYADRLLEGLRKVDYSESMKEMQSNWIGKSSGAEIEFEIRRPPLSPPMGEDNPPRSESSKVSPTGGELEGVLKLKVYTTRPDTIFGVDFMVIAPEHELVKRIVTNERSSEVERYLEYVNSRSE